MRIGIVFAAAMLTAPAVAQEHQHHQPTPVEASAHAGHAMPMEDHSAHQMSGMPMTGILGGYPMSRDASGAEHWKLGLGALHAFYFTPSVLGYGSTPRGNIVFMRIAAE